MQVAKYLVKDVVFVAGHFCPGETNMKARFIHLTSMAFSLLLSACAGGAVPGGKQPQPANDEIVIGVAGPVR